MGLRASKFPDLFPEAALEAESFTNPTADRLNLFYVAMLAHLHDEQPAPWSLDTADLPTLAIHAKLGAHDVAEDCRLAFVGQADKGLSEPT